MRVSSEQMKFVEQDYDRHRARENVEREGLHLHHRAVQKVLNPLLVPDDVKAAGPAGPTVELRCSLDHAGRLQKGSVGNGLRRPDEQHLGIVPAVHQHGDDDQPTAVRRLRLPFWHQRKDLADHANVLARIIAAKGGAYDAAEPWTARIAHLRLANDIRQPELVEDLDGEIRLFLEQRKIRDQRLAVADTILPVDAT
ncbi:hypothetical protein ASG25_15490 [Rhizobium sp. Leaf384]|nr:hypothetical protein ASG25_15490 [Rhizobium sp. Leaf384]